MLKILERSHILIVGTARNVADSISSDIKNLLNAFSDARKISFFVVESDSNDETLKILENLHANVRNFRYVSLGKIEETIPNRIERISYCRNCYLTELRENSLYADCQYVIVADLDGINSKITREAVRSCWIDDQNQWDVCAANQSKNYYDVYALRHEKWSPDDCWEYEKQLLARGMNRITAREKAVLRRQIKIKPGSEWINVQSAFGGLAIYRKEVFDNKNAKYSHLSSNGIIQCEHVALHEEIIKQGGKIKINPRLINSGWNGHNNGHRFLRVIKRKLRKTALVSYHLLRRAPSS